jgi:hypothetical protein
MKILGHTFIPMTELDRDAFAGADEDDLICRCEDCILIYSPAGHGSINVIYDGESGEERWECVDDGT